LFYSPFYRSMLGLLEKKYKKCKNSHKVATGIMRLNVKISPISYTRVVRGGGQGKLNEIYYYMLHGVSA